MQVLDKRGKGGGRHMFATEWDAKLIAEGALSDLEN